MSRRFLTIVAVAGAILWAGTGPATAHADAGVGIDPGKIEGLPPLVAGESVTLAVQVRNPGSDAASYQMVGQVMSGVDELAVDPAWFTFEPATLQLDGGAAAEVRVTVRPAPDAGVGDYLALLTAQLVLPEANGAGAQIGAAVATKLLFSVAAAPSGATAGGESGAAVAGGVAIALALVGGAVIFIRRSKIRISISRRP